LKLEYHKLLPTFAFKFNLRRYSAGIYSDYYESPGGTLAFDQLPFYAVVERLEAEKAAMVEEQSRWKAELIERERDVSRQGGY